MNLIYWPTGNPSPSDNGAERGGDNLYSDCMLALDVDTGKLKWYFQFTPHDLHHHDAAQIPLLIDADWGRTAAKAAHPGQSQWLPLCADRTGGRFLSARPYGRVT